jgi:hypothetical protein
LGLLSAIKRFLDLFGSAAAEAILLNVYVICNTAFTCVGMGEKGAVFAWLRRLRIIRVRHNMNQAGCGCKQSDARNGEAEVTQAAPSPFVLGCATRHRCRRPPSSSSAVHLCLIISAIIITASAGASQK